MYMTNPWTAPLQYYMYLVHTTYYLVISYSYRKYNLSIRCDINRKFAYPCDINPRGVTNDLYRILIENMNPFCPMRYNYRLLHGFFYIESCISPRTLYISPRAVIIKYVLYTYKCFSLNATALE